MYHIFPTQNRRMRLFPIVALIGLILCFSAIAPTMAQEAEIITAEVANLNADINLHIRSAPNPDSISLRLVPNGTELEFLGMNETRDWAFIHYTDEIGAELRGWVSADYINYRIEDRYFSFTQLEEANRIITIAENIQGDVIEEGGIAVSTPEGDPVEDDNFYADVVNLNPDANLHIRRDPDAQAESLALVPSGTALLLSGLQSENDWALVRYVQPDDTQVLGWVSADYVSYRYQGRYYSHTQLLTSGRVSEVTAETRGGHLDAEGQVIDTVDDTLYTQVVGLDEGARLHLRRLPDSSSESLILAGNGASFNLLGFSENGEWAFVEWPQEDGSSYRGWVSSTYLIFLHRSLNYTVQQLIDAGLASAVDDGIFGFYTDPEGNPEDVFDETVYAVIGGLDPGVNLHIRIAPDANSESLHLLPNGTTLQLIGMNEAGEWSFVRYTDTASGGFIEGWVSALYLSYRFRGGILNAEALLNLGRITTIDEERRGTAEGDTSISPSVDNRVYADIVGLNPDTNLHIRIAPDASSESLMLIPGGTTLAVEGINSSNTWAFIRYEMQRGSLSGWASTTYLDYHYRGRPYTSEGLLEANYIRTVPDSERGSLTGEVSEPIQDDTVYGTILGSDSQAVYRLPDENSDILYQVSGGTEVQIFALNDSLTWSFIILELANGEVRGWVPGTALQFTYRNLSYSARQLYDRRWIGRYINPVEGSTSLSTSSSSDTSSAPSSDTAGSESTAMNLPGSATIVNLPPDGRLAIQDAPQSAAATLSLQAPGTELKLFGFNSDLTWSYLRYTQPDGTTISGWAPTEYLALSHPESPATIAIFLLGDELLRLIDDSIPGSVIAGTSHSDLFPTATLIEAESASGADLSLRESPAAGAAEIGQMPGPARSTVLGLNNQLGWAYVQYDEPSGRNVLGWLSLSEVRLFANSELLVADAYYEAQNQYQIPQGTTDLVGAVSP